MKRNSILKAVLLLGVIWIIFSSSGCGGQKHLTEMTIYDSDLSGDIITYTKYPKSVQEADNFLEMMASQPLKNMKTVIASAETGETLIEFPGFSDWVLSPDASQFLKKDLRAAGRKKTIFTLHSTKDDSLIWKSELDIEGLSDNRIITAWDRDRDILVVGFKVSDISMTDIFRMDEYMDELKENPEPLHIFVLRLSDGSVIASHKINLQYRELFHNLRNFRYGGGRIFLQLKDDPFTEKRDTSGDIKHIYAVDPISGETEKIDMSGFPESSSYDFLITDDGGRIFFQNWKKYDGSWASPRVQGASGTSDNHADDEPPKGITVLELETGETSLLLANLPPGSKYTLQGITPDGSQVCIADGDRNPSIYDVETGEITAFESDIGPQGAEILISPSGRYIFEGGFQTDLWIHDIETGESRILISTAEEDWTVYDVSLPGGFHMVGF